MVLPPQCLANLVAMLAKPSGGERPIALMPMVYRIVAKIDRAESIGAWEQQRAGFWDHALAGSSALRAA
eukprot:1802968-Alexandrium_andersonii.AAC.1